MVILFTFLCYPRNKRTFFANIIYIFSHLWYAPFMDYIEFTRLELESKKEQLKKYQEQLAILPSCNMTCRDIKGKRCYYVTYESSKYRYTTDEKLITAVKRRHFLSKSVAILKTDIKAMERLLKTYRPCDYVSVNDSLPRVYKLTCQDSEDTATSNYTTAMHRTSFGLQVRSKSEALIAEMLYANKLDFKYELPLLLSENDKKVLIHPDFTIITKYGLIYWEHMGMISNDDYRRKAFQKMDLYAKNGITVPNNLIITMDSQDGIIDMMRLSSMIHGLPV